MKKAIILLTTTTLLGCARTPSFTERSSESSPLAVGFSSYAAIDEVRSLLGDSPVTVVEDSRLPPGDQRPPFNILVLSISFEHLDQSGKLRLEFFNDRLMSTSFYPDDLETYLEVLNDSGVILDRGGRCKIAPYTEIWKSTDFNNRGYVNWEDERLQKEFDDWITRYS